MADAPKPEKVTCANHLVDAITSLQKAQEGAALIGAHADTDEKTNELAAIYDRIGTLIADVEQTLVQVGRA